MCCKLCNFIWGKDCSSKFRSKHSSNTVLLLLQNLLELSLYDGYIGQKILKLWIQEIWPFGPGWSANITGISSWTFCLPCCKAICTSSKNTKISKYIKQRMLYIFPHCVVWLGRRWLQVGMRIKESDCWRHSQFWRSIAFAITLQENDLVIQTECRIKPLSKLKLG